MFFAPPQQIPTTHTIAFSGDPIDLPAALRGHTTVFILGFTKDARSAVTAWSRRLAADYRDSPTILYFEVAFLADVPRLLRPMVVKSIKQEVPPRAQPRFLPIYDNPDQWKSLAGFSRQSGEDSAYLLVVDATGQVRAHLPETTAPTDQTYNSLKQLLAVSY